MQQRTEGGEARQRSSPVDSPAPLSSTRLHDPVDPAHRPSPRGVLSVGVPAEIRLRSGAAEVVAVAAQVADAVRLLTDSVEPIDCVLLDLAAGLRSTASVDAIFAAAPRVTLIVVTDDDRRAEEALAAGAHGRLRRVDLEESGGAPALAAYITATVEATEQRRHRQRFERLLAASSSVLHLADERGVISYVSESAGELLGGRPEDALGADGLSPVHPDDAASLAGAFTEAVRHPSHRPTIEFRVTAGDGSLRWVETTISNHVADPDIGALVLSSRDITDRKTAEEALAFQARLLEAVGQAVVGIDRDRRIIYWNHAATRIYGWSAEEAIGQPIADRIAPASGWEDQAIEVHDLLDAGQSWSGDFWVRHKDGHLFPILVSDTPVLDDDGVLIASIALSTDISERIRDEERLNQLTAALTEDRRRLEDAQRSAHLGSFELNLVTDEVTWSDELYRIFGLDPGTPADRGYYRSRVHPDDMEQLDADRALAISGAPEVENIHRIIRDDGQIRWIRARNSVIRDDDRVTILTGTTLDITPRKLAEDTLAHQALHDPLTDLPNRLCLTQHLAAQLTRPEPGGGPVAVAFLDLDQFKVINDSLGHAIGDRVLSLAAERLSTAIGAEGTTASAVMLGRFGGDEFIAIRRVDDGDEAVAFADRLRSCLDEPFQLGDRELYLTASVGIAVSCPTDVPETVLANADAAMYRAKELGRARVELFDESLRRRSEHRLELTSELRRAFSFAAQGEGEGEGDRSVGELRVAYQPLIRLADGATVGFEALLRWEHPELGPISPSQFIPIAEESGLIVPIGEWVLDRALHQLADWRRRFDGARDLWMAVNLSARQLARPDLVERVAAAIAAAGIPAQLVHLEITESVLMNNIEASIDTVLRLRNLGMNLSVDDFGTGYSSLSYLKQLPIHTLKIDRSFVDGLDGGCADPGVEPTEDTSIVEAILSLGRALHLEVLAEGIETQAQLDALTAMGCQYGQGFLWSRPVAPTRAERWILADADDVTDRAPIR